MCNKIEYININEKSINELMESKNYRKLIASGNILLSANYDLHTIQNIRFINEFSMLNSFDNITLRNLIFDRNVKFSACFSGKILFLKKM